MPKLSAGLLLYRRPADGEALVLAVHPGGPFWAKRDDGAWSIPKGEYVEGDDPLEAARREFVEELGQAVPEGAAEPLGEIRQKGGKHVIAWAIAVPEDASFDATALVSNTFEMEWPPRSGAMRSFPEVDRAEWFDLDTARQKLVPAQVELVERLVRSWRV